MAEGIFRKEAENDSKLQKIAVQSAGLSASKSASATQNAIAVCQEHNIDISDHHAQLLTAQHLENTDLFVCMTLSHAYALLNEGVDKKKIHILNVSDPFGGDINVYCNCFVELEIKIKELKELILKHYGDTL